GPRPALTTTFSTWRGGTNVVRKRDEGDEAAAEPLEGTASARTMQARLAANAFMRPVSGSPPPILVRRLSRIRTTPSHLYRVLNPVHVGSRVATAGQMLVPQRA